MKLKKKIIIVVAVIVCLISGCWFGNNWIGVTEVVVESERIPQGFDGYRILQVSDLHNEEFGEENSRLLKKVSEVGADSIVITGDLIDGNRTDLDVAIAFATESAKIAPTYFVSGNHEKWSGVYEELKEGLELAGVTVLDNEAIYLKQGEDEMQLIGIVDPAFNKSEYSDKIEGQQIKETLEHVTSKNGSYKILLSHRPEAMEMYAEEKIDLVLSGHAHGGQFRIPFVGGIIAPDQGLFPKFTEGVHKVDDTTMIISRGLGNSIIPIRIFNRPELVSITLKNKNEKIE